MERKNRKITIFYRSLPIRIIFEIIFHVTFLVQTIVYALLYQLEIHGKEHLKGIDHAILISNHCNYLDPGFVASAIWPRRTYFSGLEKTFQENRLFSFFIRSLGGFPIPEKEPGRIVRPVGNCLKNSRRFIHIFPEGEMLLHNTRIAPFRHGAFSLAYFFDVPVIPITEIQTARRIWPFRKTRMVIGEPVSIRALESEYGTREELFQAAAEAIRAEMQKTLTLYSP